jgi:hypothetical protein
MLPPQAHAIFMEDGVEQNNTFRRNLVIFTRVSNALLVTDTNAVNFWVTNPNNHYIDNVAAGSEMGDGFW